MEQAIHTVASAQWGYVVLGTVAVFPIALLLWARRWHLLLRFFGVPYPYARVLLLNMITFFAGFIISDSIGGFFKLLYMREEGISMPRAFASAFLDKTFELAMLIAFGLTGLVVFPTLMAEASTSIILLAIVGVTGLLVIFLFRHPLLALLAKVLTQVVNQRAAQHVGEAPGQLTTTLSGIVWHEWLQVLLISVLARLAHFSMAYAMVLALGIPLAYWQVIAVMSVLGIVLAVPLSIGGLGTREAALIILFSFLGRPPEEAVGLALLLFCNQLPWRALGLVAWLRNPLGSGQTLASALSSR